MEIDAAPAIIGESRAVRSLVGKLERAALSDAPLLLLGGRGTGKKLAAQLVHQKSARKDEPFSLVSCGRSPAAAIEARLFGTGGGSRLVEARGGSVLLDRIDELPLALQSELGQALESGKVSLRRGGEAPLAVRIVASTSRDIDALAADGSFSGTLSRQLELRIEVPPLATRDGDVLLVADHFTRYFARVTKKRVSGISLTAAERLVSYAWPGNVLELRNAIELAVSATSREEIVVDDLPENFRVYRGPIAETSAPAFLKLEDVEKRHILHVIAAVHGNKRKASRVLGLDIKTLRRKLERYGIDH